MCVQNKVPTVINMVLFLSVVEFLSGNSALILDTEVFNCRTTGSIVPVLKVGRQVGMISLTDGHIKRELHTAYSSLLSLALCNCFSCL